MTERRRGSPLKLVLVTLCIAYAAGGRIIWVSELPSSHRPYSPVLSAQYTLDHFTPADEDIEGHQRRGILHIFDRD